MEDAWARRAVRRRLGDIATGRPPPTLVAETVITGEDVKSGMVTTKVVQTLVADLVREYPNRVTQESPQKVFHFQYDMVAMLLLLWLLLLLLR